ncbi:WPP domain-associated protein-like [Oryza brachyantha]|uniref:WPP domain-associated protein n=1 Tax=Oryza brachyantha TaxID=4533 RepID=J3MVP7_ORYBR|nr:WPP domain-associated protein-like [Oryza brachyantha]
MAESLETLDVPLAQSDMNGSATIQEESCSNENELNVDDYDAIWDEINIGLQVFRYVTKSVMKGTISAVEQEAARQIVSKDAEIAFLNEKLRQFRNSGLSLCEGRDRFHEEVYSLRQQLDTISESLMNSEWGLSVSHYNNFDGAEDVSKHRVKEKSSKDGLTKEDSSKASNEDIFIDPIVLKHMDRDDLIIHFNKMMNQMKRQHDSALQEKTEEIFRLKRENLKKEGTTPWHLRNNKEFELMRKKICGVIAKLDEVLMENKRIIRSKTDVFPGQQDKMKVVNSHSHQLQYAPTDNEEDETCATPTKSSHFTFTEADYINQIKRLESDIEDASIETIIREEMQKILITEFISEIKMGLHGYEMEFNMNQDICSIIQNEAMAEAISNFNLLLRNSEENRSAETSSLQIQAIDKLILTVDSLDLVMREEEYLSQIGFESMKGHMDLLFHELGSLRGKIEKQDSYIYEKSMEFDVIVNRLEQALQHVHHDEIALNELNDRFRIVSDSQKELEQQNKVLHAIIKEKEKTFSSFIPKELEFTECMRSVVESMRCFEKFITDQQTTIANKVQHNESRFSLLKEQCKLIAKEGNTFKKKALRYKEISETRGFNLQRAELEVDLLGDEVEALTDLLAKIYIALDHYSPVLQYYTGVMEILNMIKKHLNMSK